MLLAVLVIAACSPAPDEPAVTTRVASTEAPATTTAVADGEVCGPVIAVGVGVAGGTDAVVTASDGSEVWAFFYTDDVEAGEPTVVFGEGTKILWRITDDDDQPDEPVIDALGPGGVVIGPLEGPHFHSGSNWVRPGFQWGTGWLFPEPGCWTFRVRSETASAEMTVEVTLGDTVGAATDEPADLGCASASVTTPSTVGGHEVMAESDDLVARVLFWSHPLPVGRETRMYLSMEGGGSAPDVSAVAPDGTEIAPSWGPGAIGQSNWDHRGGEWEASFVLPSPGCWELIVTRGGGTASVVVGAG